MRILDGLQRGDIIQEKNKEIYEFGLRLVASYGINLVFTLLIGFAFGVPKEMAAFVAIYMSLRSYAGGYHAETERGCFLASITMMLLAAAVFSSGNMVSHHIFPVMIASGGILWMLGPVEDHRKPLDKTEIMIYRDKMSGFITIGWIVIGATSLFGEHGISGAAALGMAVAALMAVLGWMKNRRRQRKAIK